MYKPQILLLTAIVAMSSVGFSSDTAAADQKASAETDMMSFSQLDKNHDGQLTKTELPASTMHSKHFAKIDADGNGSLSKAEVDKHLIDDMGMSPDAVKKMDHRTKKGMMEGKDHSKMEGMDHSKMKDMDHGKKEGMEGTEGDMKHMDHDEMPMDIDDGN